MRCRSPVTARKPYRSYSRSAAGLSSSVCSVRCNAPRCWAATWTASSRAPGHAGASPPQIDEQVADHPELPDGQRRRADRDQADASRHPVNAGEEGAHRAGGRRVGQPGPAPVPVHRLPVVGAVLVEQLHKRLESTVARDSLADVHAGSLSCTDHDNGSSRIVTGTTTPMRWIEPTDAERSKRMPGRANLQLPSGASSALTYIVQSKHHVQPVAGGAPQSGCVQQRQSHTRCLVDRFGMRVERRRGRHWVATLSGPADSHRVIEGARQRMVRPGPAHDGSR
jgi:hypothetical protein